MESIINSKARTSVLALLLVIAASVTAITVYQGKQTQEAQRQRELQEQAARREQIELQNQVERLKEQSENVGLF